EAEHAGVVPQAREVFAEAIQAAAAFLCRGHPCRASAPLEQAARRVGIGRPHDPIRPIAAATKLLAEQHLYVRPERREGVRSDEQQTKAGRAHANDRWPTPVTIAASLARFAGSAWQASACPRAPAPIASRRSASRPRSTAQRC